jgi:uncharacterized protein
MTQRINTTALVTGASSGIGAAIAGVLAERKMDLVITARRADRLEALRDELIQAHGVAVDIIPHDLCAPDGADVLYEKVKGLDREIGVLVNNAGFGVYGSSWDQDLDRVNQMLVLNMSALTTLTHRYCAEMVTRGHGRILQVSSIAAYQPTPLYAVYAATKAYVLFMSQAMNRELCGTGVTITTLCPGLTESEFHEVAAHIKPRSLDFMMMSSRKVADIGVKAMLKGRPVVTPGLVNKINAFLVKLMPRSAATWVAGLLMQGKR